MADWPALRESAWLDDLLADRQAANYWARRFDQAHAGTGSWDSVWIFTCWRHRGLCIAPEVNLVAFDDADAMDPVSLTDPRAAESMFTNLPTRPAQLPLAGPQHAHADVEYDAFLEDVAFSGNLTRLLTRIREARHGPRS
jgi:hypothetical protein